MSEFQQSTEEIQKIDQYLDKGYKINYVYENLSGMFVEFTRQKEAILLQILTADARKYFVTNYRSRHYYNNCKRYSICCLNGIAFSSYGILSTLLALPFTHNKA